MATLNNVTGRFVVTVAAIVVALAIALGAAAPSNATTGGCANGRCTVYLSKAETRALSEGRVPALPAAAPWQIKASFFALVQGHRWFAGQYANRGWCSSFRLSIYPWESQGYNGYRC
ncbi:hypothetical protein [Mycobacterium sp. GA-1841]|uniref:hypothetical protein n=1 Tax=Mycobacterium sp. GA-1841 TaxID=1834154 RepID=UPI001115867C|nr:hypothetical protein [Mycobacterium sp. GA-1841]